MKCGDENKYEGVNLEDEGGREKSGCAASEQEVSGEKIVEE